MVPAGTYGMMVPAAGMVPYWYGTGTRYQVPAPVSTIPYVPAAAAAAAAAGVWLETKDKPIPVLD